MPTYTIMHKYGSSINLFTLKSVKIPKSSTTGVTFRLPSEKLNTLRKVSETKNITPNTLVNQIIKAYLDLHRKIRKYLDIYWK